jgi:small subunit ribosomal protein S20
VANHPSAEKRNRQRIARTARNRAGLSAVRTIVKKVRAAVTAADSAAAQAALKDAMAALSKAGSKGVMRKQTASRRIGRLAAAVNKLGK